MSSSAKNHRAARIVFASPALAVFVAVAASAASQPTAPVSGRMSVIGTAPLYFEANRGQIEGGAQFIARGPHGSILLEPAAAVMSFGQTDPSAVDFTRKRISTTGSALAARIVRLQLLDADARGNLSGVDALPGQVNYLMGNDPAAWRTGIPIFAKVQAREVYPGIDVIYYANESARLEYDFVLKAGANADQIRIQIDGADQLKVDAHGDLVVKIGSEEMRQHRPVIYQDLNGERQAVAGGYRMLGKNTVGFQLAEYDRKQPLIIDPVLDFSTYLGGKKTEDGWSVAVDAAGNIYVAGETVSKDLPTTPGAYTNVYGGGKGQFGDAFVAKYDAVSNNLVYLTYFGGKTDDGALALDVDKATGEVYLTGFTDSKNFPIVPNPGAIRTDYTGRSNNAFNIPYVDAFVTELNASGSGIVFSTLMGGDYRDSGAGIVVRPPYVYVCGMTESSNFVPMPNGFQTEQRGAQDAFLVKLIGGTDYVYATYLGGEEFDFAESVAVDAVGQAYLAGFTSSIDFPVVNPLTLFSPEFPAGLTLDHLNMQDKRTENYDAFAAKFSADGLNAIYSSYLGGTNDDAGYHIAVDAVENAYVTGFTLSKYFPTNQIAQPVGYLKNDYNSHVFVTKIGPNGGADVPYSLEFGSKGTDQGTSIAVDDATGYAYVTGFTSHTNFFAAEAVTDLRSTNTIARGSSSGDDVFIAVLSPDGSSFVGTNSILYGGRKNDEGFGIALRSTGPSVSAYIVGRTASDDFPLTNAPQTILGNGKKHKGVDAFVGKVTWP